MELKVIELDIKDLKLNENNAKEHPDWQVEQIARSIEEFGFNDPVAVNKEMQIIEGHGRYLAAQKLGIEKIPCIILDNMTAEQERAYTIVHNKLCMNTGFDIEKLQYELNALKLENFNIDLTGFDDSELDDIFNKDDLEEINDIEEVEDYNETYNIIIVCDNYEEAKELNEKLNLQLDLSRQLLKRKYKDIKI